MRERVVRGPETHWVRTPDGWTLALHRLRMVGVPSMLPPVLFLPGYATDHRCFLPGHQLSLPELLARRGRDCWLLDFRGGGASWSQRARRGPLRIVDRARYDLPAAIEAVCKATGASEVDAVGHSLGGVLLYAHLGRQTAPAVRRAVTLASPGWFRPPTRVRAKAGAALATTLERVPRVPLRRVVTTTSWMPGASSPRVYFHPTNRPARGARRYLNATVTDVYGPELARFVRWFTGGGLQAAEGLDIGAALCAITTPTLFVAGAKDRVVPVAAIAHAHEQVRSADKGLVVLEKASGAAAEYAHLDLLAGRWAPVDVHPPVVDWLERPR